MDSDGDGVCEFDIDNIIKNREINGCVDPSACNFEPEATDNYPMFTGWTHLGSSDSTRFFITPDSLTLAEAQAQAALWGAHLATISNDREAVMTGFRSEWTNAWVDAPETISFVGYTFESAGTAQGKWYYVSTTDDSPARIQRENNLSEASPAVHAQGGQPS